ncbi:hypothetical protein AX17_002602 [Amanita inopinata Kibby_2008]|nr:hypothetical protein AX17_002602 [Amanita inopinata Kibby_2008]
MGAYLVEAVSATGVPREEVDELCLIRFDSEAQLFGELFHLLLRVMTLSSVDVDATAKFPSSTKDMDIDCRGRRMRLYATDRSIADMMGNKHSPCGTPASARKRGESVDPHAYCVYLSLKNDARNDTTLLLNP